MKNIKKLFICLIFIITSQVVQAETVLLSTKKLEIGDKVLIVSTICKDNHIYTLYTDGDRIAIIQEFKRSGNGYSIPIDCGVPNE